MLSRTLLCLSMACLGLGLSACQRQPSAATEAETAATASAQRPFQVHEDHVYSPQIDQADFAQRVKTLSSDAFAGRAPGSEGEQRTVDYIRDQMQQIGLQPGNHGQWFQSVPMIESVADPATQPVLHTDAGDRALNFGQDIILGSRSGQPEVKINNSELVFVGYGVDAPEKHWNDYADQDWTGKTVVMFVNDPGFQINDDQYFDGPRMTWYGRWTYKFEEAARKGAVAALIVHDTDGAGYDWEVVRSSWSGPQYDLPVADDPAPRLQLQGWLSAEAARQLFADAGIDLQQQYRAASRPGFRPLPLQASWSVDLKSTVAQKQSRNVIGVLPGEGQADEAVLYSAHWDHLGQHPDEHGDNIYNGAIDNATGVAGILEIAEQFAHQQPRPKRSLVFAAVTLEEAGLLGSQYYVQHPTFPLNKIAGVINLDAMSVAGRARDLTVVGMGSSELEDILKPVAAMQGRTLHAESSPQNGGYFRSDHFSFARAGVPALYVDGGEDLRDGGRVAGHLAATELGRCYHAPCDEYHPDQWKLDGVVEDLQAVYAVGNDLASSDRWPQWYPGNPFRAVREQMMHANAAAPPRPSGSPPSAR